MTEFKVVCQLIFLVVLLVDRGICEEYFIGFNEGFSCCEDYENKILKSNMNLGKACDDGGDSTSMYLTGYLQFCEDVAEGTMINVDVVKVTELGSEKMWGCTMDVCKSLEDEDAPWATAMQTMNITKCPIKTGKYHCDEWMLDLGFMNDKLCHEWEGDYGVEIKLQTDSMDTIGCYHMGLVIAPKEDRK